MVLQLLSIGKYLDGCVKIVSLGFLFFYIFNSLVLFV